MLDSFLPLLLLLLWAIAFPLGLLAVTQLLGPKVRTASKAEPYECGIPPVGSPEDAQNIKFYRLAILFLVFDVEAALLFPWAILFREELPQWGPFFLIVEFAVFVAILLVGYLYAWHRGALEWD